MKIHREINFRSWLLFYCIFHSCRHFAIVQWLWHIQASARKQISFQHICPHQTSFSGFAASLWHLLDVLLFQKTSLLEKVPTFTFQCQHWVIFSSKSNIVKVAGFTTASDMVGMSKRLSSGITEEHFSVPPLPVRAIHSITIVYCSYFVPFLAL